MADKDTKSSTPQKADQPPTPPPVKGEKRLFQIRPGDKVWMTEAEATKRGFFWKSDSTPQTK